VSIAIVLCSRNISKTGPMEADMSEQSDLLRYKAPKHLRKIGVGAIVVAILVVAYGITSRASSTRGLQATADEAAIPAVKVIKLAEYAGDQTLVLPGSLEAFN